MLQLNLSDQQVYCILKWVLYEMLDVKRYEGESLLEICYQSFKTSLDTNLPQHTNKALIYCNVPAPTTRGFEFGLIAHPRITSQRSIQLSERARPASDRLAGWLSCHIPSFLNGTRHPRLVIRHSHKARKKTASRLWMNYQCTDLYPGLRTSPQCDLQAPTTPPSFEPGLIAHSRVASQRFNQLGQRVRSASDMLAGGLLNE